MAQYQPVTGRGQFKARDSGHNATIQRMREQLMPFLNAHKENANAILNQQTTWLKAKESAEAMEAENRKMIHGFEKEKLSNRITQTKSVAQQHEQYGEEEARGIIRQGEALANFSLSAGKAAATVLNTIAGKAAEFHEAEALSTTITPEDQKVSDTIIKGSEDIQNKQRKKDSKIIDPSPGHYNPAQQERQVNDLQYPATAIFKRQKAFEYKRTQIEPTYEYVLSGLKNNPDYANHNPKDLHRLASHIVREGFGVNGNSLPAARKLAREVHAYSARYATQDIAANNKAINAYLFNEKTRDAIALKTPEAFYDALDGITGNGSPIKGLNGETYHSRRKFAEYLVEQIAKEDYNAASTLLKADAKKNGEVFKRNGETVSIEDWIGYGDPDAKQRLKDLYNINLKFQDKKQESLRRQNDIQQLEALEKNLIDPNSELSQKLNAEEFDKDWFHMKMETDYHASPATKAFLAKVIYNRRSISEFGSTEQQAKWLSEKGKLTPGKVAELAQTIDDKTERAQFNKKWNPYARIMSKASVVKENENNLTNMTAQATKVLDVTTDKVNKRTIQATKRALRSRHADIFHEVVGENKDPNLTLEDLNKKAWKKLDDEFSKGINDITSRWHITPSGTKKNGNELAQGKGVGPAYFTYQYLSVSDSPGYKALDVQLHGTSTNPDIGLLSQAGGSIEEKLQKQLYIPLVELRDVFEEIAKNKSVTFNSRMEALYQAVLPEMIAQNGTKYLPRSAFIQLQLKTAFGKDWENFAKNNPTIIDAIDRKQVIGANMPLIGERMPNTERQLQRVKTAKDLALCSTYVAMCKEGHVKATQNRSVILRQEAEQELKKIKESEQGEAAAYIDWKDKALDAADTAVKRLENEGLTIEPSKVKFSSDGIAASRRDRFFIEDLDWSDLFLQNASNLHDLLESAGLNWKGLSTDQPLDMEHVDWEPGKSYQFIFKGD